MKMYEENMKCGALEHGSLTVRWKEESSVFKCILYVQLHKDFSRNHTRHEYYHQRQQFFFIHKEALSMRMLL